MGLKVLVIDLDPQGNACTALGVDREKGPGMYEVLIDEVPLAQTIQKVAGFAHLECAPANRELAGAEIALGYFCSSRKYFKERPSGIFAGSRGERRSPGLHHY